MNRADGMHVNCDLCDVKIKDERFYMLDKPNDTAWWCPIHFARGYLLCSARKSISVFFFIYQACWVKIVTCLWTSSPSWSLTPPPAPLPRLQKKVGQYPAIWTSRWSNYPYFFGKDDAGILKNSWGLNPLWIFFCACMNLSRHFDVFNNFLECPKQFNIRNSK